MKCRFVFFWVLTLLVVGCSGDKTEMLQQLEMLEQQNRSGEPMLNDSVAESLVNFFDRYGDANERMRSRYILGRTYYCLGELSRALETYNKAINCADSLSVDCNYRVLSRIHAQCAVIYHNQVQPRSQLYELRMAQYFAKKANDTLVAIDCYAQMAEAYKYLGIPDSVIILTQNASREFMTVNRKDMSSQVLVFAISPLVEKKKIHDAKQYIDKYESESGYFDKHGDIQKGREVYYYIKGKYYLAVSKLDSAEFMFRKELRDSRDLNNQIAGCKGLQEVFVQKRIPDSIAKYANLGYILNDSAYSLAEMQNIQKFQASYNYNHHKSLAEEKVREVRNAYITIIVIICFVILVSIIAFLLFRGIKKEKEQQRQLYLQAHESLEKAQTELLELKESDVYSKSLIDRKSREVENLQAQLAEFRSKAKSRERANLEELLEDSDIVKELKTLLKSNPVQPASQAQMKELKKLINEHVSGFYDRLNTATTLRTVEYEVCLLVRCHFKPAEICKLMDRDDGYISNLRRGILLKVYGIKGSPSELDRRLMQII